MKRILFTVLCVFILLLEITCLLNIISPNLINSFLIKENDMGTNNIPLTDIFDFEIVTRKGKVFPRMILRDKNTDVLYFSYQNTGVMTPILQSDGTPLTYKVFLMNRDTKKEID